MEDWDYSNAKANFAILLHAYHGPALILCFVVERPGQVPPLMWAGSKPGETRGTWDKVCIL